MSKKYYWLKLQKDFFKRHDIQIIEDMPNGKDYVLFYLKLLVESIDHEGHLRFSETIPYNEQMLATVTHTNVDIVRSALKVFTELQMVEVLDDETIFLNEVEGMLGSCVSDEGYKENHRLRQQRYRERQKALKIAASDDSVTHSDVTRDVTRDVEIEIEKEIEIDNNILIPNGINRQTQSVRQDVQKVIDEWNSLSELGIKSISRLSPSSKRYKSLIARLNEYSLADVETAINNIRTSDFLLGRKTDFVITFDWFVLPNNFPKVLEGNYNNKGPKNSSSQSLADKWGI